MDNGAVPAPVSYTTRAVAEAAGYSVQQVRDLERLGVIPPALRQNNGYRRFGPAHVTAFRAYRNLASAVGPVVARATMREASVLPYDEAVARIVALHTGLARSREDAIAALRALDSIVDELTHDATPLPGDSMTITELSSALGVRASTLRFWEHEGLLSPERFAATNARRYPPTAIHTARIVAALRAGGYRIPAIRTVMDSINTVDDTAGARDALQSRLHLLATRSEALLRAGTDIADVLSHRPATAGIVLDNNP